MGKEERRRALHPGQTEVYQRLVKSTCKSPLVSVCVWGNPKRTEGVNRQQRANSREKNEEPQVEHKIESTTVRQEAISTAKVHRRCNRF